MGKMLDFFQQARLRRGTPASSGPTLSTVWPDEEVNAGPVEEEEEEIPFIEVGGPREPGEGILLPPLPPLEMPRPKIEASPVHNSNFMTVRFQPLAAAAPEVVSQLAVELVAFHQPDHAISAQYRDLTTSLLVQTPMEQPRVLLFTGASAGVGTTTVVLNTAITLARHNLRRVVIVDVHYKRPAAAVRLGLPESPGLRNVLAGRVALDAAVRPTAVPGLMVLPAGSADLSSSARLAGERMREILWELREHYDLVVLDAPHWDGRPEIVALGSACDAVYLCLPEKDHETEATAELMQIMPEQGAQLRGCILTSRA